MAGRCVRPCSSMLTPRQTSVFVFLRRELRNLAGKTPLPCNAAAAIFLRYDSDRIDKMRAVISGEAAICRICLFCCHSLRPWQRQRLKSRPPHQRVLLFLSSARQCHAPPGSSCLIDRSQLLLTRLPCKSPTDSHHCAQARRGRLTRAVCSCSTCSSQRSTRRWRPQ